MDASAARITVAAALELPALRRGLPEVVAGAEALDRPIRWVHAGEVRNIASLLRGGELLLTTGMAIGPTASDQRTFVAELAAREVAALAIELGNTYNNRLPAALVAAAERHGLPLIELHAAVPFVAVTEAIHTEIVNRQYDLLRRAEGLQERFTQLMLQGGGIPGVLALLAEALANPVFLEAADGRLLYHASATGEDPVGAWAQAAKGGSALAVAAPVPGAGQLVALPVDAPLDGAFARLAVERAAGIVALALLRTRQEDELLARGRGDLLADLAAGRIAPEPAAARAAAMGFAGRAADALLPIVARGSAAMAGGGAAWLAAVRDFERELSGYAPSLVGVDPGDGALLMVLVLRDGEGREAAAERVARHVHGVDPGAVVAVAGATGWDGVGRALRDAAESAAAATDTTRPWHDATRMALDRLLWRWRDQPDLTAYVDRMLGAVLAHDAKRKHQLLPTLEALCLHGGRKAETSRALHLNRQALYDRITRLEQVLDADLSDARTLLALHVALEARRHGAGHPN
ncbi:PucR family transcriptional regulator [Conexibacter woesei]|uniref:PucR family transcriptional regulator n=1 Tax=Conexibacter woesei TaxID=191495 RepID=UPI0004029D2F|nr:PucR family transcriptional regulator [Conexibacter woesei]